jgi:hypothetical protein
VIRIAKIILGLAAGLLGIAIVVLVGVNLYLQSGPVQERIRLATADAFGAPVEVRRTTFTPWGGLNLTGLSVPDPNAPRRSLIEANRFSVRFEWLPLLSQRFVVNEVTLSEPALSLRQTDKGDWILPMQAKSKRRQRIERERPSRDTPLIITDSTIIESPGPGIPEPAAAPSPPAYHVELQKFTIRDGAASFVDRKGRLVARATGISADARVAPNGAVSGDAWIADITIHDSLHPRKVRAHFKAHNGIVDVSEIKAALAGGRLRADVHVDSGMHGAEPAFTFDGELDEVSLRRLISEADGGGKGASGSLNGKLVLHGDPRDGSTTTGFGDFALVDATIEPFDLIRMAGQLLRIDELQLLALDQAELKFEIRNERAMVNRLLLKSENLMLTATGPVRFDGRLNLDARLLINEKLQKRIGSLSAKFSASEDAGYKQLPFKFSGRLDSPETDLLDRIIGTKLPRNVGDLLQGFIGGLVPTLQAPVPDANPAPTPVPAPSPASSALR